MTARRDATWPRSSERRAREQASVLFLPGGHWPSLKDMKASTLGSLIVAHKSTRSPRRFAASPLKRAKRAGRSRSSHEPRFAAQRGSVK